MSNPNGPQAGSTPSDADELHGNGDNPYSGGDKWSSVVDVATSTYPTGNVPGYYTNPATTGGNPHSMGIGEFADQTNMPSPAIERNLGSGIAPDAPNPTNGDIWEDEGFARSGLGRSV